jgi:hypothetical protein
VCQDGPSPHTDRDCAVAVPHRPGRWKGRQTLFSSHCRGYLGRRLGEPVMGRAHLTRDRIVPFKFSFFGFFPFLPISGFWTVCCSHVQKRNDFFFSLFRNFLIYKLFQFFFFRNLFRFKIRSNFEICSDHKICSYFFLFKFSQI